MRKKEYTIPIHLPYTQIRSIFRIETGDVATFVVKLEYNVAENPPFLERWNTVARFDHNPLSKNGHDIREEGLHMDLCEPYEMKDQRARGFPEVRVNEAVDFCERYFKRRHLRLTKRFCKKWGFETWNRPNSR